MAVVFPDVLISAIATHPVIEDCPDANCMVCSVRACPSREALHFSKNGCPSCSPNILGTRNATTAISLEEGIAAMRRIQSARAICKPTGRTGEAELASGTDGEPSFASE